ncbi:hypothetical protein Vafri_14407 [Volvox africanus]|uniref:Protein kinase domain-containing protein n=1 Tax=Volvox africanus TaxID=51714 RepID=A0A8J4F7J9_9CHLO|nr:hypothetical protein Vafri_14407 [Volvox africanus]
MFALKNIFSCLGGTSKRHERSSMPSSEPTYPLCRFSRLGEEANNTVSKPLEIASQASSLESVGCPGNSQRWSLHRLLNQPPVQCHLKLVSTMKELLSGIYLEQKPIICGHDSIVCQGLWHGATCNVKFLRVSSLTPELLAGIDLLITQSHPFILQYYLARAVHVPDGSWWRVVDGPALRPNSDEVDAEDGSIGIESILGSTFFGTCVDKYSSFCQTETVEAVLEILQPKPEDFVIALVTEICILSNVQRTIPRRHFEHPVHFSAHAALRTVREIALGLMHLHLRGAAHGNLRPSQIILVESHADRRGFIAKVADAGLGSRHSLCQTPRVTAHTAASGEEAAAGSSHPQPPLSYYKAPELLQAGYGVRGEGVLPLTIAELQAADVFAFGCILYEILNGVPTPHVSLSHDQQLSRRTGEAPKETLRAVDFPRLDIHGSCASSWASGCDPQLRLLCCCCLSADPQHRPVLGAVLAELNAIDVKMRMAARAARSVSEGCCGGAGEDPHSSSGSSLHVQGAPAYVPLTPVSPLHRNCLNSDSSNLNPEPLAQSSQTAQLVTDFDEQRQFDLEQPSGPLCGFVAPQCSGDGSPPPPASVRWKGPLDNAAFSVPAAQTGLNIRELDAGPGWRFAELRD